jgi:exopolyphosphatase/guanosine-5'-triphosphate,3'-diphosphate pyrophosphatase
MTLAEREKLVGIDPHRAEIILAGAMVLEHVLRGLDLETITISDFGVREGLVMDYLLAHAPEIRAIGGIEELRLRSVLQLLQKFQPEERHLKHARHVAQLSLALFDGLARIHRLGAEARETLHYAALLHDVGAMIGYDGHGQHSDYIIRHGNLRDLTAVEVDRIATVARYHGKARPRKRDEIVRGLSRASRRELRWLSAMLRIAEALDRSHYQLVKSVEVKRRGRSVTLQITAAPGARLEMWAARRRTDLLEKLLGGSVRLTTRARPQRARGDARRKSASPPAPAVPLAVVPIRTRAKAG